MGQVVYRWLLFMQVEGLPRKNNYQGRWDVLFDQANDCLRKMLETATRRNKNYILDQVSSYFLLSIFTNCLHVSN